jgi:hypothetical protein
MSKLGIYLYRRDTPQVRFQVTSRGIASLNWDWSEVKVVIDIDLPVVELSVSLEPLVVAADLSLFCEQNPS